MLRDENGFTLVEMMVGLMLTALLMALVIGAIEPVARMAAHSQNQARAHLIADALIERLRAELVDAQGYLCLTESGGDAASSADVFSFLPDDGVAGTAVQWMTADGEILLFDAGYRPETLIQNDPPDGAVEELPALPPGTLHRRCFEALALAPAPDGGTLSLPVWRDALGGFIARACVEPFPADFYAGCTVSLAFAVRSSEPAAPLASDMASPPVRLVTALDLTVTVYPDDAGGTPLCTDQAILDTPNRPILMTADLARWAGAA